MNKKAVLGGSVLIFVILAIGLGIVLSNINSADAPQTENESGIIVNIPGQGRVRGRFNTTSWTNETVMQFLSIPYAESPIGALRFKAPVPRSPWSHIHDSTKFGRACPTMDFSNPMQDITTDSAEDCLTLSVFTKSLNASVAVIFLIVGGAFIHSDGSKFHGEFLLNADVVFVVLQYRLGALGFLSYNTQDLPGNMALADAIMALEWVQNNIHNFGGDRNQVTLAGESAGSYLTGAVLLSPKTENRNLFHRVIIQSGQILSKYRLDPDPIEQTRRFCRNINCKNCEASGLIYQCLMAKDLSELRNASVNEKFEPKVETQFEIMPQHPMILLENYNRSIPVMAGFQRHDGSVTMMEFYMKMKEKWGSFDNKTVRQFALELLSLQTDYSGVIKHVFLRLMFDKTPGLLDSTDHKRAIPAYFDIASMIFVKSSILNMAKRLRAKQNSDIFVYTFDYPSENSHLSTPDIYPWINTADHGQYAIFLFATDELKNDQDIKMAQQAVSLWTSFAISGIPKGLEDMPLSPMTRPSGPYIHLNVSVTQGYDMLKELTTNIDDPNKTNIIRDDIAF